MEHEGSNANAIFEGAITDGLTLMLLNGINQDSRVGRQINKIKGPFGRELIACLKDGGGECGKDGWVRVMRHRGAKMDYDSVDVATSMVYRDMLGVRR